VFLDESVAHRSAKLKNDVYSVLVSLVKFFCFCV
jgi:hypothetical protein